MKLQRIMMSCAMLVAFVSLLSFNTNSFSWQFSAFIYSSPVATVCVRNDGVTRTNESNCSNNLTGPVCTTTPSGLTVRTAYQPDVFPECYYPWRQY